MNFTFLTNRIESHVSNSEKMSNSNESEHVQKLNNKPLKNVHGETNTDNAWASEKNSSEEKCNINVNEDFKKVGCKNMNLLKQNSNNELNNTDNTNVNMKESFIHNKHELGSVKLRQNRQCKRFYDGSNDSSIFQQILKKLKRCTVSSVANGFTDLFNSHITYTAGTENALPVVTGKHERNEPVESQEASVMENDIASVTSTFNNQESIYLFKKKMNAYNAMITNSNKIRNKSKTKSRKRKRFASRIDKKFIIKCKNCKYIHPNGFKVEDYYECENCGDNDFAVVRAISPADINNNINSGSSY